MTTLILSIVSTILAALVWGAASRAPRLASWVIHGAWICLVAIFALIYADIATGGAAAAAAAAAAAVAALPPSIAHGRTRTSALATGGALALSLGVVASIWSANTFYDDAVVDPNLVLVAGQWATLAASLSLAAAAAGAGVWGEEDRPRIWAPAALVTALLIGAWAIGSTRSEIVQPGYAIGLVSQGEPLRWALPSVAPGASQFGFRVTLVVKWVQWLIGLGVCGAIGASIASYLGRPRIATGLMGCAVAGAAASLGAIVVTGFSAALPDAAPYAAWAAEIGAEKKIPEALISMGGFQTGESIYVMWIDILPDIALLGTAALVALATMVGMRERGTFAWFEGAMPTTQHEILRLAPAHWAGVSALWARDLGAKAAATTWLAWGLSGLLAWRLSSIYGFRAPSEWMLLGATIAVTGLAMIGWRDRAVARFAHATMALVLVAASVVMTF